MGTIVNYTNDFYPCPVTHTVETVRTEHTTTTKTKNSRSLTPSVEIFVSKKIQSCSGIDNCGVKVTNGPDSTFQWQLCPLIPILKSST
jgi:hypothetical protein